MFSVSLQTNVYFGRDQEILNQRELIKKKTMKKRRKQHLLQRMNL